MRQFQQAEMQVNFNVLSLENQALGKHKLARILKVIKTLSSPMSFIIPISSQQYGRFS
jgi:hypothetical protein